MHDEFESISNASVLIRAHGEPPQTYSTAHSHNIHIIDATCPVVLNLQQKIRNCYLTKSPDSRILIFGQKGHAEVNGLVGQAEGNAQVIQCIDDIEDWTKGLILFAQTTMSEEDFCILCAGIRQRLPARLPFAAHNTICRSVSGRVKHLRAFAAKCDVVVFVCGALSSNGNVLFNVCKTINTNTYRAECSADLQPAWFNGCSTVGVCGATSTPQWLMQDIADAITHIA
jgi:4-hydroxy-3-methylbut-2-enyl diphosphate reductase